MLKEFEKFALRGNLIDLAIGVIIGGAVGGLVNSIVADILMPVIGLITGGIDFTNHYVQLSGPPVPSDLAAARKAGATIAYGNFVTLTINFVIVAFVLFLLVKLVNRLKDAATPPVDAPPQVPADVALLTEIRDLLRNAAAR